MAMLHFPSNNACNFQCACKYVKCKMQGLRVGKHCVFPGFGSPPMAMLHFPSNNACNLRCACRYVKCRIQGLGLGNLVFFQDLGAFLISFEILLTIAIYYSKCFAIFCWLESHGTSRGSQRHFPDPWAEICHAICDACAYVKCKMQALRVG